jgi:glycyl-tRNA synthetase
MYRLSYSHLPLLTPTELINKSYTAEDIYVLGDLALRPETTMGSFEYAKWLLNTHNEIKQRAPIIVFQHGKSFRREQDQSTKFMRLKEFYQLEYQIIFSPTTAADYSVSLYPNVLKVISDMTLLVRLLNYLLRATSVKDCQYSST